MTTEGNQAIAAASGAWSYTVVALEADLGEGPAFDAISRGREITEPEARSRPGGPRPVYVAPRPDWVQNVRSRARANDVHRPRR